MASPDEKARTSVRRVNLRDRLWRTFEVMSEEQEKSLDDLVNDAMAAYAQLAGYETTSNLETVSPVAVTPVSVVAVPVPVAAPGLRSARSGPAFVPPIPGPVPVRVGRPPALPSVVERGASGPSGPHAAAPPPIEGLAAGHATLHLVFDNQKYRIDKEQFIIGRGSKSSDLPIKDGNISRKHAAVIRRNGAYFIKDLGSTNGIDFKGMRIDNKRIDEGDVFHICEYELKFTYKR
jgi:neural Wiskott-Aldrich syndrome protein